MENVLREVNSELFEFVAKNVYETYQYLVSMEEVLEYVRLVMVDLAEKKIKVVKQGEVIDMVSKLIINDTKLLILSLNLVKRNLIIMLFLMIDML